MSTPVLQYENPRDRRRAWTWYHVALGAAVLSIVITAFASQRWLKRSVASTDSKWPPPHDMVQSLRSTIALFKLQHNDRLPGACPLVESGGPPAASEAVLWDQLTRFTDVDGNTSPTKTATHVYGPYVQSVPTNPLNGSRKVASAAAPGVGFVYDYASGTGSGKVWGVDANGDLIPQ